MQNDGVGQNLCIFVDEMEAQTYHIGIALTLLTLLMAVVESHAEEADSCSHQRQLVVVDMETGVPLRNVEVSTDDGQHMRTPWNGVFCLRNGYKRVDLACPNYQSRYLFPDEVKGDTIGLLPNLNALREVIVYGQRRDKTAAINAHLNKVDAQLMQKIPVGFDPLALVGWAIGKIVGPKGPSKAERQRQKQQALLDNY